MLPGQMLQWQLASVKDGPRNLLLKLGQNHVSNSWDIDDIEFVVVLLQWVGGCLKMEIRLSQPQLKLKLSWGWAWQKCCPKNCGSTNFGVQKNQSLQKIGTKKSGQNLVSNSWDIPNMDQCFQDKCCVDKCHCDSWYLWEMVPGTFL